MVDENTIDFGNCRLLKRIEVKINPVNTQRLGAAFANTKPFLGWNVFTKQNSRHPKEDGFLDKPKAQHTRTKN